MLWMFIWSLSASHIFLFALQDKFLPKRTTADTNTTEITAESKIHVAETEANS